MAATTWSREGSSMRVVLALVIPVGAALLQGTVAPLVAIGGAPPALPILVAGAWSVAAGAREGVWWAFVGGLATDLLSGGPLGAFACASLPPVAAIGLRDRSRGRTTPVLAGAVLVGLAAFASALLYLAILAVAGQPVASAPLAAGAALASAAYTGALALVVYPLARAVRGMTEKQGATGW
jgi:rod shape-determining protein MreD